MKLNRIVPQVGPENYKTYQIARPKATHTRPATCAEVECKPYQNGWVTRVPRGSEAEQIFLSLDRKRFPYKEMEGTRSERAFLFPPGVRCFKADTHVVPVDRPALYVVKGGDWRGNPRGDVRRHTQPMHWVEDMQEHLDQVRKDREG